MSEDDLREVGISTLGSRRKLQIAISGKILFVIVMKFHTKVLWCCYCNFHTPFCSLYMYVVDVLQQNVFTSSKHLIFPRNCNWFPLSFHNEDVYSFLFCCVDFLQRYASFSRNSPDSNHQCNEMSSTPTTSPCPVLPSPAPCRALATLAGTGACSATPVSVKVSGSRGSSQRP